MTKKVMVFGTFDGVHEGHRALLRQARQHGDHLTVVVARDTTVMRLKGRAPVHSEDVRQAHLLAELSVDAVCLGVQEGDRYDVIRREKPSVIVLGYDQEHFIEGLLEMIERESHGIEVIRAHAFEPERYKSSLLRD